MFFMDAVRGVFQLNSVVACKVVKGKTIFQGGSIKQLEQIVQRLVQATERDGEVSLFMSRYNLLKYGQIKVIYTCKMLLIVT